MPAGSAGSATSATVSIADWSGSTGPAAASRCTLTRARSGSTRGPVNQWASAGLCSSRGCRVVGRRAEERETS
ncbi:hypothetical protein GY12_05530 [Micrococcus luteus]|nr:hypothetical protein GY12_05530 [Micrococcus luteus]